MNMQKGWNVADDNVVALHEDVHNLRIGNVDRWETAASLILLLGNFLRVLDDITGNMDMILNNWGCT